MVRYYGPSSRLRVKPWLRKAVNRFLHIKGKSKGRGRGRGRGRSVGGRTSRHSTLFKRAARRVGRIALHHLWKAAYKVIKHHMPFAKLPVSGGRGARPAAEGVKIHMGDPNFEHKIVTTLFCNEAFDTGHATLGGISLIWDPSNVNDPMFTHGDNHPMYHAEWLAKGFDRVYPLAATYNFKIHDRRVSTEHRAYIFWRIVTSDTVLPIWSTTKSVNEKLIQDLLASKEWSHKMIYADGQRARNADEKHVTMAVNNIPEYLKRMNTDMGDEINFSSVFSDSASGIGATTKPRFHLVIAEAEGNPANFTATDFRITVQTKQTVLLQDSQFVHDIDIMDEV